MIRSVDIYDLGPHARATVAFGTGTTRVSGPSESGKSALVEAVCFALWGKTSDGTRFPEALIRDGAPGVAVELQLDDQRVVRRTLGRTGDGERAIDGRALASEAAFARALGPLGDARIGQLVMVPLAWTVLARANARPLRDLVLELLPGSDPAEEVARRVHEVGHTLRAPAEARLDEKQVAKLRRDARKSRDEAEGRRQALAERTDALASQISAQPADDAVVALHRAWLAWDAADARYQAAAAHQLAAREAARSWDLRAAALGDAPEPVDLSSAERDAKLAEAALAEAREAWRERSGRVKVAREHADAFVHPGVCPTCGRDGWDHGVQVAEQARGEADRAARELDGLAEKGREARSRAEAATAVLARVREADARRRAYGQGRDALGPRPVVPPEPVAPRPPELPRPPAGALEGIEARLQRIADLEEARRAVTEAAQIHGRLVAEAERLDVLLTAVREAPSAVVARQQQRLGDLGPVSLVLGIDPAIEVRIDGRPWWTASRGRLVVADLWLRAALRRAWGVTVPLFVDNVQDVAGQPLPDVEGPVVLLRTVEQPGLVVGS